LADVADRRQRLLRVLGQGLQLFALAELLALAADPGEVGGYGRDAQEQIALAGAEADGQLGFLDVLDEVVELAGALLEVLERDVVPGDERAVDLEGEELAVAD